MVRGEEGGENVGGVKERKGKGKIRRGGGTGGKNTDVAP